MLCHSTSFHTSARGGPSGHNSSTWQRGSGRRSLYRVASLSLRGRLRRELGMNSFLWLLQLSMARTRSVRALESRIIPGLLLAIIETLLTTSSNVPCTARAWSCSLPLSDSVNQSKSLSSETLSGSFTAAARKRCAHCLIDSMPSSHSIISNATRRLL